MAYERLPERAEKPSDSHPVGLYSIEACRALEAHSVERKLAAIFAADVEGLDEVGTLGTLTAYLITSHRGRIFNTAGDRLVADFASHHPVGFRADSEGRSESKSKASTDPPERTTRTISRKAATGLSK
jgi:class 3 adenylate cyclase